MVHRKGAEGGQEGCQVGSEEGKEVEHHFGGLQRRHEGEGRGALGPQEVEGLTASILIYSYGGDWRGTKYFLAKVERVL